MIHPDSTPSSPFTSITLFPHSLWRKNLEEEAMRTREFMLSTELCRIQPKNYLLCKIGPFGFAGHGQLRRTLPLAPGPSPFHSFLNLTDLWTQVPQMPKGALVSEICHSWPLTTFFSFFWLILLQEDAHFKHSLILFFLITAAMHIRPQKYIY